MRRLAALALLAAGSATAQMPTTKPGAPDPARVTGGTYAVDPAHTEILFEVDHLGFSTYWGIFHSATGTLTLDPKRPGAASVEISVPVRELATSSTALNEHLMKPDFFDAAKYPTATFRSTKMTATGTSAKIAGNLTLHGVTKPIVLDATFHGAGKSPMPPSVDVIGFSATTSIRRSDFGLSYGTALISDVVPLKITVAFEKK